MTSGWRRLPSESSYGPKCLDRFQCCEKRALLGRRTVDLNPKGPFEGVWSSQNFWKQRTSQKHPDLVAPPSNPSSLLTASQRLPKSKQRPPGEYRYACVSDNGPTLEPYFNEFLGQLPGVWCPWRSGWPFFGFYKRRFFEEIIFLGGLQWVRVTSKFLFWWQQNIKNESKSHKSCISEYFWSWKIWEFLLRGSYSSCFQQGPGRAALRFSRRLGRSYRCVDSMWFYIITVYRDLLCRQTS